MLVRRAFFFLSLGALAALIGCSGSKPKVASFPIGQKVQVGKLSYQVLEASWVSEVQGAKNPPKNRVLQLRLAVTNSGGQEATIPLLKLIGANGNETLEIAEIEENSQWMGALRRLQPAIPEEGYIYFDVPVGAYRLEVVDNSNVDDEKQAHIEIPASLAPPVTQGP
jgi:hypothetical protein